MKLGPIGLVFFVAACASNEARDRPVPAPKAAEATSVDALLRIAATTRAGGNLVSAAAIYQRAHDRAPQRTEPLFELGITLGAANANSKAVEAFRAVLEIEPGHAAALDALARTLLNLDQLQPAFEAFEKLSQLDPANISALNGMGVARDRSSDHKAAQIYYRKALAHSPANISARNNLGLSLALSGNYDAAIALLKDVAADTRATPRERQNLALAYGLAGDSKAAERIGRIDASEAVVQNNLAYYRHLQTLSDTARANSAMTRHKDAATGR